MDLLQLVNFSTTRPTRLDSFCFHCNPVTGQFSVGWVVGGTTVWNSVGTSIGLATAITSYIGGTVVSPTQRDANFTFGSPSSETVSEITITGLTAVLSSTDAVGTRYEVYDKTGNANPNFTITPNGGKLITSPGAIDAVTLNITSQGFWRSITKMSDGNWLMAGI